jgi:phosphoglycerate dehydrogenase-like enzyme
MKSIKIDLSTTLSLCFLLVSILNSQTIESKSPSIEFSPTEEMIDSLKLRQSKNASSTFNNWRPIKKVVIWGNSETADRFKKSFPGIEFRYGNDIKEAKLSLKDADAFLGYCIPQLFDSELTVAWIHSMAVGVENCINSQSIQELAPTLTNAQRLSGPEIAEHAIGLMFALVRRLDQYGIAQQEHKWDRGLAPGDDKVWEIAGKTMLVVGLGGIGTETAKRADGLGMKVIATRNSSRSGPEFVDYVGLSDELLALAKQADIVVNTVPLTAKTTGLFDAKFFEAMKETAYFINIARGKSVETSDLIKALDTGQLAGAGLDVTDPEPLPKDHPLWSQPRVIITPHVAYRSEQLRERNILLAIENLKRFIAGEPIYSVVNIKRGY